MYVTFTNEDTYEQPAWKQGFHPRAAAGNLIASKCRFRGSEESIETARTSLITSHIRPTLSSLSRRVFFSLSLFLPRISPRGAAQGAGATLLFLLAGYVTHPRIGILLPNGHFMLLLLFSKTRLIRCDGFEERSGERVRLFFC